jgi:hypothetical protein
MKEHCCSNDLADILNVKKQLPPQNSPAHHDFAKCAFDLNSAVGQPNIKGIFRRNRDLASEYGTMR